MAAAGKICLKVYGKVQGVYFRASTQRKARELGITGFVENLDDGSVYIEAEGSDEAMNAFLDWVSHGPSAADVENVVKNTRAATGFNTFQIRY